MLVNRVLNLDLGYYPAGVVNTRFEAGNLQRGIYMVSVESGNYCTITKMQVIKL